MNPATMAKHMPVNMYCSEMILWSVDQQYLMNQFDSACPCGACGALGRASTWGAISAIGSLSSVLGAGRRQGGGVDGARGGDGGVLLHPRGVLQIGRASGRERG